jgi:hypothetical protein
VPDGTAASRGVQRRHAAAQEENEMSHKNFLITAMGRSGTKFLASVMNRSVAWTVEHEPTPHEPQVVQPGDTIWRRFEDSYYGEVNSRMRWVLFDLPVAKRGVILRHPADLMLAIYNKRQASKKKRPFPKAQYLESLELLDRYVKQGVYTIRFERMTTDPAYLQQVLYEFGIEDVEVGADTCAKKVNALPTKVVETVEELPGELLDLLLDAQWFMEKYYGEQHGKVQRELQGQDVRA